MDIVPSSETGQALQAAIQKQLASHGWSSEDDTVMAEYCLVMLGNRKTPDQISTELSDLIGAEFEPSFVTWLFTELARHYPDPVPSSQSAPDSGLPDGRRNDGDMRYQSNARGGPRDNGHSIFGAAMSGMKRDARDMDTRDQGHQRARYERPDGFDGIPAGPRSNALPSNQLTGRNGERWNERGAGRSLVDRMQGGYANGFDPVQNTIDAVTARGQFGAFPNPQGGYLSPQALAQAQAQVMAQAQAFAAMQGQQLAWNQGGNGFNGQFAPNFGAYPQPPQQRSHQARKPYAKKEPYIAPVPIPTKPVSEQICKHGIKCTKSTCPFSHPSPVATESSGIVLSSEACEAQLSCTDMDCSKSHVSVAQKNPPTTPSATGRPTPAPTSARPPPVADPNTIPGAGERPCKFAGACTRAGCVFIHPWDARGGDNAAVPCHWAENCTRVDCHFSHPPSRPTPYKAGGFKATSAYSKKAPSAYTATFNNPSNAPISAWPSEGTISKSDRLKRFTQTNEGDGPVERIIPGEATVEVEMDDDDVTAEKVVVVKEETMKDVMEEDKVVAV